MNARLEKVRDFLREQELDAVLVTKLENLQYFSGFTGDDSLLLLSEDTAELVTDFRYTEQAAEQTADFAVIEHKHGLLKMAAERILHHGWKCVGFEGADLCYDDFAALYKMLPETEFHKTVKLDVLRVLKDETEISYIRKAVEISDRAFSHILTFLRPGISEIDVAAELEDFMRRAGSERPAFTTIVASGQRGSLPHGFATEKLIVAGEFVTMDFGAVYKGYHSDITRTVCIGKADAKQREIYDIVLQAQQLGVREIQTGRSGKAIDASVRRFLFDAGYARYFGHGLGHSVGLEIHEEPRLSPSSTCEALEKNMVITVEPGVYIPGWGGIRIEDTVLVTSSGGVSLTQSNKQFMEIF